MKHLTEKDLAARWSMTTRTLQSWRKEKKGVKFVRLAERSIVYREEDVIAYENAHTVGREEHWRAPCKRAASAFDALSKGAKKAAQRAVLAGFRDELRAALDK